MDHFQLLSILRLQEGFLDTFPYFLFISLHVWSSEVMKSIYFTFSAVAFQIHSPIHDMED